MKDDEVAKHRSRKDTKKWCRGKTGKMHTPKWVRYDEVKNTHAYGLTRRLYSNWWSYVCSACGKQIDHCFPWSGEARPAYCDRLNHRHQEPVPE